MTSTLSKPLHIELVNEYRNKYKQFFMRELFKDFTFLRNDLLEFKGLILIGIIAVLISRMLIVYPTIYTFNRILKPPIPSTWNHILFWGGLRGTIPIILMLQLPEFQYRPLFLSATFGIVLFSIIVQGLTIEPFLKKLKLQN